MYVNQYQSELDARYPVNETTLIYEDATEQTKEYQQEPSMAAVPLVYFQSRSLASTAACHTSGRAEEEYSLDL